jgi:hypothetical protein
MTQAGLCGNFGSSIDGTRDYPKVGKVALEVQDETKNDSAVRGDPGKHTNPMGEDCHGRSFVATKVGVGGVYVNTVKCTLCERELPAWEHGLLPESTVSPIRKPTLRESASDDYRLQCGRIIQTGGVPSLRRDFR